MKQDLEEALAEHAEAFYAAFEVDDDEGATRALDEAEKLYTPDFSPNVRPVPAQRARVLAAQGRWREALDGGL